MNGKRYRSILRDSFFLLAGVVMAVSVLFLGRAYARYQESQSCQLELQGNADKAKIYFRTTEEGSYAEAGTWEKVSDEAGGYDMDFLLSNASGKDAYGFRTRNVTLQIVASAADLEQQEAETEITLTAAGQTYRASGEVIAKDSVLWKRYGDGRVYRFYNESGEEVSWTLQGGKESNIPMNLHVKNGRAGASYVLITGRVDTE